MMKIRMVLVCAVLSVLTLMGCGGGVSTYTTFEEDGLVYTLQEGETSSCAVSAADADAIEGALEIPATVKTPDGKKWQVVEVASEGFEECVGLTSVALPEGLKRIGSYAFQGCENMRGVKIPESTREIATNAFSYCHALTEMALPGSLEVIGWGAFEGCSNMEKVVLPASPARIGGELFHSCTALTTIETTGTGIFLYAKDGILFSNELDEDNGAWIIAYPSARGSVAIPEDVVGLWDGAFSGAELEELIIPAGLTTIENAVFEGCDNLKSIKVSPDNPAFEAEDGMLFSAGRKKLVAFPGVVGACTIPDAVEQIGATAFSLAPMHTVLIPGSVKLIEEKAFFNSFLEAVYFLAEPDAVADESVFQNIEDEAVLYVYADRLEEFKEYEWTQAFSQVLPFKE